ncbi:VCBS repeat-containing protein [Flavilitoribacter nigricans]|uniref:ASPIC/UnbV domain-containing protein n=1 Tax=Flavilitoribacter nigricans (strain ATCC 23147 / DSM 23189 / NBRC 102662 / NCIMB 1420 / SS-2) TaxID=1122177 RepID=A0A2D0ND09_FLAN2|nr:VCBS repeat-containing protein [Flavilitoribacter nigricans]PHN06256.1 hypothetical protein CRP01_11810 [Flavilitoribacter nigricans DSM 23189 = NBRC 102662]
MIKWPTVLVCSGFIALSLWSCRSREKLFTALPGAQTGVDFTNLVVETDSFNINQYLYAYNGGGVALGDINNDGLVDIYLGSNQGSNRLFLNKGDLKFEDVTEKAGVQGWIGKRYWTTGLSMVDINHDGWLDLYVNQVSNTSHLDGHNLLFINNQDGTFSEQSRTYGLDFRTFAQQTVFFDYDRDGDLDAYLLNHSLHELDVYVKTAKRDRPDPLAGDRLMRNDGGVFKDASKEAGIYSSAMGYGLSVSLGDVDNNGCPDIYVSNDFHENDYLYLNQCDGTFREQIRSLLPYCSTFSMGSDMADLNNNGWLDIMSLDMKPEDEVIRKQSSGADPYDVYNYKLSFGYHEQYPRNMLHLNQGTTASGMVPFTEVAQQLGVEATDWSWSVLLADLDNDTHKDLHITNGIYRRPNDLDYINYTFHEGNQQRLSALELVSKMPDGRAANYAYRNRGGLQMENVSEQWGLDLQAYSMGSAYGDLDNDGDLDLIINNLNAPATLYRNNTDQISPNQHLTVKLEGPEKNPRGIGTRLELFLPDQKLMQEVYPVRGWLSSSDYSAVFGLGTHQPDSLIVRWPDGRSQTIRTLSPGQPVSLQYEASTNGSRPLVNTNNLLQKIADHRGLEFSHLENNFTDFDRELLLPHEISREGPPLLVADLNGDGAEDVFIGGAAGQSGRLFFQDERSRRFVERIPEPFMEDEAREDIDAVFFDADADGDPDLYVVSGGGQYVGDLNADRLYLNDGLGNFSRSTQIPAITANGACVVAADFNRDGFTDLFIGNRSVVGNYGYLPDAYLLWNRGNGRFAADRSEKTSALRSIGMITDASWDEKAQQLLVVGEFMPISILRFQDEELSLEALENTHGWWNTIHPVDIDWDGDLDFLVGNYGLNSPLHPSSSEPVRLIVKDWDNNGQSDPMLTHYRQGKEWLYHGLDAVKKQIPVIRLRFNDYHLYAKHTLDQTFSEADLNTAEILYAETFESVVLINQGADGYIMQALPAESQTAPIFAFYTADLNGDQLTDVLAMGNTEVNPPSIGNQKASTGFCLLGAGNGQFRALPPGESGLAVTGSVRKIRGLDLQNDHWILVAKNNDKLEVWQSQSKQRKMTVEGNISADLPESSEDHDL